MTIAPPPPRILLSIGVTGHRTSNHAYAANRLSIEAVMEQIFDSIAQAIAADEPKLGSPASVRLNTLLSDGADQYAAEAALARGWELVAPLPFGRDLNVAVNARPARRAEAQVLLAGEAVQDGDVAQRAEAIRALYERSRLFELADADESIAGLYFAMLDTPGDIAAAQDYSSHASERVALAGRVMIEQSDIIIGVWDGASRAFVGGTGHTIEAALDEGAPVVLIDANAPDEWRILHTVEALLQSGETNKEDRQAVLAELVRKALHPAGDGSVSKAMAALGSQTWRSRSNPLFHMYRRVEALFCGGPRPFRRLRLTYETPGEIAAGSGAKGLAALEDLPGADPDFAASIGTAVLRRFAWADSISTHFSDFYRGGMVASFVASGLAIVIGVAYLPFVGPDLKWPFALAEFLLLASILIVIALGRRGGWHARWFETRRVAEYLRHSPILLALGAARSPGRWPRGTETSWPEYYALQSLREVGLPRIAVTQAYLRAALQNLLDVHVVGQRDYHRLKAVRLTNVHRNLDRLSGALFQLAVVSVAAYLALWAGGALQLVPDAIPHGLSKWFTLLGVLFPTFGGAIAGIRYFGDFDRFAAISEVSAEKLDAVHLRAEALLAAPEIMLDYGSVADLAQAADDIVVSEIENWQAVFAGKHITVPA